MMSRRKIETDYMKQVEEYYRRFIWLDFLCSLLSLPVIYVCIVTGCSVVRLVRKDGSKSTILGLSSDK